MQYIENCSVIEVETSEQDGSVFVKIKDYGAGITEEKQKKYLHDFTGLIFHEEVTVTDLVCRLR